MKKTILLVSAILLAGFIYAQNIEKGVAVQVLTPETVNLPAGDAAWLPGQIQDKVKSNVQDYLELKTVVDSKAEAAVKNFRLRRRAVRATRTPR